MLFLAKRKKWIIQFLLIALIINIPFIIIISFNFYIDPLWNFSHSNKYNQVQEAFDERQLKVNYLNNHYNEYDTLLVGTSRTTYINQHDFPYLKVFNFSASSLHIKEYNEYIEYFKKKNLRDLNTIILEVFPQHLDFPSNYAIPKSYFTNAESNFYSIKSLFSFDTFEKSRINYNRYFNPELGYPRTYNRENVANAINVNLETVDKNILTGLNEIQIVEEYEYNPEYRNFLLEIKENNPNTNFILFSPPYYYERIIRTFGNDIGLQIYKDWLSDCIDVFGSVENFLFINEITMNKENYYDSHHFYPDVGTIIANEIVSDRNTIAKQVTKENFEEFMDYFEQQVSISSEVKE